MSLAISVENVSKLYHLGSVNRSLLWQDGKRWLRHKLRGDTAEIVSNAEDAREDKSLFWALKDINFEIKEGETVGIVGRNGAGKSTLLKILSRITAPSSGMVKINGRVGSLLEIGTGFHPELSGRDNLYLYGSIMGMGRDEIRGKFDDIVSFSELEKFIDTPVKRYSSGMYVRLAFSVAAFLEPEILIVDEALSVGDQDFQRRCLERIEQLLKGGRTLLYVSHDMNSVKRICTRAIEMEAGQVIFDGSSEQAARRYLNDVAPQESRALQEWPDTEQAPGDETARLLAVRSFDANGALASKIPCSSGLRVEMDYRILREGRLPQVPLFHFFDSSTMPIFTTFDMNPATRRTIKKPGLYRSVAYIPPEFLAPARLSVWAVCVSMPDGKAHFSDRDSLFLEIEEAGGKGTLRDDHTGPYPGLVRPRLNWETCKL